MNNRSTTVTVLGRHRVYRIVGNVFQPQIRIVSSDLNSCPKIAREDADLTSMMRIVLDEIREHVDRTARHSFTRAWRAANAISNRGAS